MSVEQIEYLQGIKLAEALEEDAEDCSRPDRAALLMRAANEIRTLIAELKRQ